MKCELSNNIKFLALKYHCLTKKSLERSFRWAKRNFDSYFKLIDKYNKNLHYNLNEEIFKIYEKNNNSEDNTRDNLKEVKASDEKEGKNQKKW